MASQPQTGPYGQDHGGGLARRLGTADAVVVGLGSMIGAGVFAAGLAGRWLVLRRRA
ncbi:hypothetical protein OG320_29640 [Microbispora sp. NBC_01189]|uniref:hypothetical protein n=1 Tax=Microbispora sp. NBC_01189 TaxID=2903583 RepID=UPI002E1327C6|nr:hypothetical protein OG320_29640 [Microbispora sp. NBC_01189]